MIKSTMIGLGARVPADLRKKIANYCDKNGIKLQFFVSEAIKEKLADVAQDQFDNMIVDERLQKPQLTTKTDLQNYIAQRIQNG